jgi:hypothetical protein
LSEPKYTEDEKSKFKDIGKMVREGFDEEAKSINQLEDERSEEYVGDSEQEKFKTRNIWHNKVDLDIFVAEKLNLNPEKWGKDKSKNTFYKRVANAISKLRNEGEIVDWKFGLPRHGIWRLANNEETQEISSFENNDYSCPVLKTSVVGRTKQEKFRKELIKEYDCKCVFCGFGNESYLRAAHIVPFAEMQENEPENAVNPANGLLLCALCDIAFEKGDIMVGEGLQIIQTDKLLKSAEKNNTIAAWILNIKEKVDIKSSSKFRPGLKFLKWKIELNFA